jgi:propanol-preferring alcohol dehydrogenase
VHAAPLLCAGLIGYRAYAMTGAARRLGLYGFGAATHIVARLAVAQGREVYAFTRDGDTRSQQFARSLGAVWAGPSSGPAPVPLDAAVLFAADGRLVPLAGRRLFDPDHILQGPAPTIITASPIREDMWTHHR